MTRLEPSLIEHFKRKGFVSLPALINAETLSQLRKLYDQLLAGELDTKGSRDSYLGDLTRQLVGPEHCHTYFKDNPALTAGKENAAQLFDWEPVFLYSQLLYKPPHHPHETPWHQDAAYTQMPVARAGSPIKSLTAQFWLALDDADEANGCMHFHDPVSQDRLLPHRVVSGAEDNDARLLGLINPQSQIDPSRVTPCPLRAGEATVHEGGTLHYTPANSSDRPRRAYIFNFADRTYVERSLRNR